MCRIGLGIWFLLDVKVLVFTRRRGFFASRSTPVDFQQLWMSIKDNNRYILCWSCHRYCSIYGRYDIQHPQLTRLSYITDFSGFSSIAVVQIVEELFIPIRPPSLLPPIYPMKMPHSNILIVPSPVTAFRYREYLLYQPPCYPPYRNITDVCYNSSYVEHHYLLAAVHFCDICNIYLIFII